MAKKTVLFKIFFTTDFIKGLVVGLIIAIAGFLLYGKYYSASIMPPENSDFYDQFSQFCENIKDQKDCYSASLIPASSAVYSGPICTWLPGIGAKSGSCTSR